MNITSTKKENLRTNYLFLSLSFLISLFFSYIYNKSFIDYGNYFNFAEHSSSIIGEYRSYNIIRFITNEPLWLYIVFLLNFLFDSESTLKILVCFISFLTIYNLSKIDKIDIFSLIIILISPLLVKNFLVHIRQGFAISIFIFALNINNKYIKYFLIFLIPFIHSSFFILYFIIAVCYFGKIFNINIILNTAIVSLISILLAYNIALISNYLDARQSEYYDFSSLEMSGFAFIYWTSFLFIILLLNKKKTFIAYCATGIISFYISSYWFTNITSRVFESGLILILIYFVSLNERQKTRLFLIFLLSSLYTWAVQFSLPGWGFVVSDTL